MNIEQAREKIKEAIENNSLGLNFDSLKDDEKLSSADLTALMPDILVLKNLQNLNLDDNQINDISMIADLKNLQTLYLHGNQISDISVIAQLKNLRWISFGKNQFTEIPKEITTLPNLQSLYFDELQLRHSAAIVVQLKNTNLNVFKNTMYEPIPLEISSNFKNEQELLDYYFKTFKGRGRELNEAKVLFVGQGSVGKTSLIKRLITGEYNPQENKTEGIDINKWKVMVNEREVQLNVWDFGGQEIMHATHQFFLTKRSLYVLVLDSRLEKEENRVDYWLEKIKSFGGDSPVIIVGNKTDQHPLDINQGGLSKKYTNIKAFYEVSCQTEKNIDKLRDGLIEEIGKLGGIHDVLPKSWFEIKEELEKIDKNYIPYDDYLKICAGKQVESEDDQNRLIRLLHDLGIILNFSDDAWMQDTNVLNPEWVTQGVYKILNSRELFRTKGELTKAMLAQILDTRDYPKHKHLFIVDMMRRFELCFDITANEKFLVPDLLAEEEIDTGNWTDALKFEYQYKVFFNSIVTRFIVKMHEYISRKTYWRTGVVLIYQAGGEINNRALIKADSADRKVFIYVDGNKDTRREFLSRIRAAFEQIHGTFAKEFVEENVFEKVPVPKHPEIVVDYKHLLNLEKAGREFITPEGLLEEFRVKDLLKGIEFLEQPKKNAELVEFKIENLSSEEVERLNEGTKMETTSQNITRLVELVIGLLVIGFALYKKNEIIDWWKNGDLEAIVFIVLTLFVFGGFLVSFALLREKLSLEWIDKKLTNGIKRILFKANGKELDEYHALCRKLEKTKKELAEK
jgi:internalin A